MSLTLLQLKAIAKHAIGGEPAVVITSVDLTKQHIVNQAGVLLVSLHEWNWLRRPATLLSFTNGQDYVALPVDLAEVIEVTYNDNGGSITLTSPAAVDLARANDVGTGNQYLAAVNFPTQANVTSAPGVPRLELHPTPTASTADIIRLRYRADWVELDTDTDVANVPRWIEPLLEDCVRAVARGRENGQLSAEIASQITSSPFFAAAVKRDGQAQVEYGPPIGGAAALMKENVLNDRASVFTSSVAAPS